ncbi:MAG: DEAD/DEAH box helicase [Rhodobacteraceae bacterium]|nr:DEAD/DEAH box helicase [Paracoccaceae bacterium]MBR9819448.1 DEAD/DEAH box helicase [Paracoccaceae bacterium]
MTKFSDLDLDPKVLKAIADAGYESPTPIQAGAIPHALAGKDVLGIAQTGTGKTASFTLPMITRLAKGRARARMPRSLVLCPTRELAAQVAENFDTYTKYMKLTKALLIGGVSFKEQEALIDRGVDVLIATPGRLLDHFERGKLLLTGVQIMVVDEADRMLDMGFIPDIERIFSLTPFTRQTLFFSATMAPEIERITNTFLSNPERIEVARQATTGENIQQQVVMYKASRKDREGSEKRRILRQIIDMEGESLTNAIVFCNRKTDVDVTAKSLKKYGYDAAPIHGDLDQSQRTRTLDGFRDGSLKILVASDVAARGLDVPSVSHVFNFDVPSHSEDYVHRIGRTGRAGRKGKAVMICVPRDEKNLADIEKLVEREIPRLELPGVKSPAPAAEAPETEEAAAKPSRSRTRTRSRKPKEETAAEAQAAAPATETQPDAKKTEAKAEDRPARTERAPRKESPAKSEDTQRDSGRDSSRNDTGSKTSRGNSRGKRGSSGNDSRVVGMGDHMPSFIALSFEQRRAS